LSPTIINGLPNLGHGRRDGTDDVEADFLVICRLDMHAE
jgi:hypothetical protein